MKLRKLALIAAVACGLNVHHLTNASANEVNMVSFCETDCDCGEPVCGCETAGEPQCDSEVAGDEPLGCDGGLDGSFDGGCDSAAGAGGCLDGELGEPWTLFGDIGNGITVGGWASVGYHTAALPLFNSRPDEVQLHQGWLYAEKALDTSNGFDIGGRFDYIYGTDGPDTQAFGIDNDHWDNGWDNGGDYGHAIPQAYVSMGYGDWTVKMGHFFTIIGWEVVAAPDNFFYSHAYTMYNSEPFTHTGALAIYNATDDLTFYGGYVMGWDSGFEDNGDSFLGGVSTGLTDSLTLTYATVMGRFAEDKTGGGDSESGYMHSVVFNYAVSESLTYIFQSDVLESENTAGDTARSTFGINQYLIYSLSERVALGSRFEWYNNDGIFDDGAVLPTANLGSDVYALTGGINYRPHSNVIVRPEVRYDWVRGDTTGILEDNSNDQFTFGMDAIFLF